MFAGAQKKGQTLEETHRLVVEAVEECCDFAGKHGVFLGLENHGGITEQPEELIKLVQDVKSPWLGINFDSGNFHSADPYKELEQIAPYAINAQVKVVIKRGDPKTTKSEPSDLKRLAKMLRDVGYRGYIVLEYEEDDEDPRDFCPKYLEEMRAVFV
ncbi:MAG: TIM barrel protein [Pirellulales bacterium]